MKIDTGRRTVLVLGPRPTIDLAAQFARVRAEGGDLLILVVGFPLSTEQERTVNDAVAMAVDTGIWLEARIAYRAREVADYVHRDDHVRVFAKGGAERAIGRALRRAGLMPTRRGTAAR